MYVYRILKAPYLSDPLSVTGSELSPGRWNQKDQGLLYTASHPALALLETMAHFETLALANLPEMRLFRLEVDETLIRMMNTAALPAGWNGVASMSLTQAYLTEWINEPQGPILSCLGVGVPSAILEMSTNYLFAPKHVSYFSIKINTSYPLPLDSRLWRI